MKRITNEFIETLKKRRDENNQQENIVAATIKKYSKVDVDVLDIQLQKGIAYLKISSVLEKNEIKLKKQKILSDLESQSIHLRDII